LPDTGIAGSHDMRSSSRSQGSPGVYTIDGEKTKVSSGERRTASSASAFARKNLAGE